MFSHKVSLILWCNSHSGKEKSISHCDIGFSSCWWGYIFDFQLQNVTHSIVLSVLSTSIASNSHYVPISVLLHVSTKLNISTEVSARLPAHRKTIFPHPRAPGIILSHGKEEQERNTDWRWGARCRKGFSIQNVPDRKKLPTMTYMCFYPRGKFRHTHHTPNSDVKCFMLSPNTLQTHLHGDHRLNFSLLLQDHNAQRGLVRVQHENLSHVLFIRRLNQSPEVQEGRVCCGIFQSGN